MQVFLEESQTMNILCGLKTASFLLKLYATFSNEITAFSNRAISYQLGLFRFSAQKIAQKTLTIAKQQLYKWKI